jgi:hypothetical protein
MGFFRHSSGELHYTTALDSLELGSPLQSITRGGAPDDERLKQPPIGSRPLQRTKLRKSTFPGFPDPGSFPSRRFSRPQGLSPSEAARACSIPLPLLGFCLEDLPLTGGTLSGTLSMVLARRRPLLPEGHKRHRISRRSDRLRGEPHDRIRTIPFRGRTSSLGTHRRAIKPASGPRPPDSASLHRMRFAQAMPGEPCILDGFGSRYPKACLLSLSRRGPRSAHPPETPTLIEPTHTRNGPRP